MTDDARKALFLDSSHSDPLRADWHDEFKGALRTKNLGSNDRAELIYPQTPFPILLIISAFESVFEGLKLRQLHRTVVVFEPSLRWSDSQRTQILWSMPD